MEEPAFPVDASTISFILYFFAKAATRYDALSLNDPVGLEPSSFIHRFGKFDGKRAHTVADSICVDIPKNGYHAVRQLKEYKGRCVCVSDEEILAAQKELSSDAGLFTEPAGAAAFAGFLKEKKNLENYASIAILTTGSGLKDIKSAMKINNILNKSRQD